MSWREDLKTKKDYKIVMYEACFSADNMRDNVLVSELQKVLDITTSGAEIIIKGQGGKNSIWGVADLKVRVLNHNPDLVMLEFGGTDSKEFEARIPRTDIGVSLEQSRSNLNLKTI